ncbi:MAG TPA: zf-TFIIB domain-containing protein [Rhodothermales bacterium]|nr:zf-TFIIB domain-containing protein [Rhodothermales bacterium]
MFCPVCIDPDLVMTERQGIEIDYCPKCRGVWLDRGELDKLIERAATPAPAAPRAEAPRGEAPRSERREERGERYESRDGYASESRYRDDDDRDGKRRKRRGLLGELFDFD